MVLPDRGSNPRQKQIQNTRRTNIKQTNEPKRLHGKSSNCISILNCNFISRSLCRNCEYHVSRFWLFLLNANYLERKSLKEEKYSHEKVKYQREKGEKKKNIHMKKWNINAKSGIQFSNFRVLMFRHNFDFYVFQLFDFLGFLS